MFALKFSCIQKYSKFKASKMYNTLLYFTQKNIQVYINHMLIEQGQNGYRKVNSTFD